MCLSPRSNALEGSLKWVRSQIKSIKRFAGNRQMSNLADIMMARGDDRGYRMCMPIRSSDDEV